MEQQIETTLDRANFLIPLAVDDVRTTLNARFSVPVPEALADETLDRKLLNLQKQEHAISEIAVLDPKTNEVLADSDPSRVRQVTRQHPDYRRLVANTGWFALVLRTMIPSTAESYQLEMPLEHHGKAILVVRAIVGSALIREDIGPALRRNAKLALVCLGGALTIVLFFQMWWRLPQAR